MRDPEQWKNKRFFTNVEGYKVENPRDLICWPVWGTYPYPCEEVQGDGILRSSPYGGWKS